MKEDEVEKRVEVLRRRFMAERASYVDGRCKVCGENGLVLLVTCGQWTLRCYHNPEHENASGWV